MGIPSYKSTAICSNQPAIPACNTWAAIYHRWGGCRVYRPRETGRILSVDGGMIRGLRHRYLYCRNIRRLHSARYLMTRASFPQ